MKNSNLKSFGLILLLLVIFSAGYLTRYWQVDRVEDQLRDQIPPASQPERKTVRPDKTELVEYHVRGGSSVSDSILIFRRRISTLNQKLYVAEHRETVKKTIVNQVKTDDFISKSSPKTNTVSLHRFKSSALVKLDEFSQVEVFSFGAGYSDSIGIDNAHIGYNDYIKAVYIPKIAKESGSDAFKNAAIGFLLGAVCSWAIIQSVN